MIEIYLIIASVIGGLATIGFLFFLVYYIVDKFIEKDDYVARVMARMGVKFLALGYLIAILWLPALFYSAFRMVKDAL